MKKIILTSAIIFATVAASFAQTSTVPTTLVTPGESETINLSVKLNPVQAILVNTAQKNVTLEYNNIEDYQLGVTSEKQKDHLKIYSAGGFSVTAAAANLTSGKEEIDASSITITAEAGSNPITDAGNGLGAQQLTSNGSTIISSTKGGNGKTFDITYKGAGAFEYVEKHLNRENPTIYTTVVTYTIAAN